jgi:hypothetical protein
VIQRGRWYMNVKTAHFRVSSDSSPEMSMSCLDEDNACDGRSKEKALTLMQGIKCHMTRKYTATTSRCRHGGERRTRFVVTAVTARQGKMLIGVQLANVLDGKF